MVKKKISSNTDAVDHLDELSEDFVDLDSEGDELIGSNKAQSQVKKLKAELAKVKAERAEYLDGWQRSQADYVNLKKAHSNDISKMSSYAGEAVLTELISVLDSFDMAFANKQVWGKVDETWRLGVEHIHTQLLAITSNFGLKAYGEEGDSFDPERHDSVESVKVEDSSKDNIIVSVLQRGYQIKDKIIRAARVKVGKFD